jgi:hypothetical protein
MLRASRTSRVTIATRPISHTERSRFADREAVALAGRRFQESGGMRLMHGSVSAIGGLRDPAVKRPVMADFGRRRCSCGRTRLAIAG